MNIIEQAEFYNGLEMGDINGYPVTLVVCRKSPKPKNTWIISVNAAVVCGDKVYHASDPSVKITPQTCARFEDSSTYTGIKASAEYPVKLEMK